MTLTFVVQGVAEPKGSTRALPSHIAMAQFRRGRPLMIHSARELLGNIVVTSDNVDVKKWQADVKRAAWCAIQDLPSAERGLIVGAVALQVEFFLPRPSGLAKKYTGPHLKKPDLDKLTRAVGDTLSGTCWSDDSQVTRIVVVKGYAGLGELPRAVISVTPIDPPLLEQAAPERTANASPSV